MVRINALRPLSRILGTQLRDESEIRNTDDPNPNPSQILACFCLHLGTRLMKLLEIGTQKIPNHQEKYLGLTVEWFLRRENKPWLTNIIQKIRSLDGR